MSIGTNIKTRRQQLGFSAETLAEMIGVSPSTIYRYENNDISNMGIDKLKSIAEALNTQAAHLLGWDSSNINIDAKNLMYKIELLNRIGIEKVESYIDGLLESKDFRNNSSENCSEPDVDAALEEIKKQSKGAV